MKQNSDEKYSNCISIITTALHLAYSFVTIA